MENNLGFVYKSRHLLIVQFSSVRDPEVIRKKNYCKLFIYLKMQDL